MKDKSQSSAKKIKDISAKFDLAESLISDENVEILNDEVTAISNNEEEYNPADIMSLRTMSDDFNFSRETLKESLNYGRKVLELATQNLLLAEGGDKASHTLAYAELTTSILNGVKSYSQLYKDFSQVLLNIKKISTEKASVNNTLNVFENVSTTDLIERLKNSNKD